MSCCVIDCDREAEWQIWPLMLQPDPYDYTEACTEHVGELLHKGLAHCISPILKGEPNHGSVLRQVSEGHPGGGGDGLHNEERPIGHPREVLGVLGGDREDGGTRAAQFRGARWRMITVHMPTRETRDPTLLPPGVREPIDLDDPEGPQWCRDCRITFSREGMLGVRYCPECKSLNARTLGYIA